MSHTQKSDSSSFGQESHQTETWNNASDAPTGGGVQGGGNDRAGMAGEGPNPHKHAQDKGNPAVGERMAGNLEKDAGHASGNPNMAAHGQMRKDGDKQADALS
ncbi:hypothetical protein C8Q77DRAFT_64840 [Trametes polyzona]|nr:hypothetical protein C8Q77DRAFT_64840 [Trametes polyzona]